MRSAFSVLAPFVLERLDDQPSSKRLALLRALKVFSPTGSQEKKLSELIGDLAEIEQRQRELALEFSSLPGKPFVEFPEPLSEIGPIVPRDDDGDGKAGAK